MPNDKDMREFLEYVRVLPLVGAMHRGTSRTLTQIQKHFGISKRTVYRRFEELKEDGFTICTESRKGHKTRYYVR